MSLILALSLLLESCLETGNSLVPESGIPKDAKAKSSVQLRSTFSEGPMSQNQRRSREQILQEKEDQLLSKIFKTSQGYTIKFYKDGEEWRASVVDEVGVFSGEFDLPAYLGEDEDLAENIERLLFNVDKFGQVKTRLIQVVLSSKEREGYVCIEGGWGGMKKQGSDKKKKEEEGGEKEKGESSKVLQQATPKKKKRKRRKSSLASGVSITPPMTLPSTPIQSPTKKPKMSESSSKKEGEKITEVGKKTGSQKISQASPSEKKKRKRKRRSSLSLVTSPATTSTPAHPAAKKLREESKSPTIFPTSKKYTPKGSEEEEEEVQESNESKEDDELEKYDYSQLAIPIKPNGDKGLPIVAKPRETIGKLESTYKIDGKTFKCQNVSGGGMRCFFNAAGLNVEEQIRKLREYQNDPIVRYMIANEIVSGAKTPDELPKQVKDAINYTLYESQQDPINSLREQRNKALKKQNTDSKKQNENLLPQVLRKESIEKKEKKAVADLRQRALSLKAFNAFLHYHIGNEEMMVMLPDLKGEDPDNEKPNYSSIDAIAYINKLGIKIYRPYKNEAGKVVKGKLHLAHQFIPANATRVVYLYHSEVHFQALIPEQLGSSAQISPSKQQEIERDKKGKQKLTDKEIEKLEKKKKKEDKLAAVSSSKGKPRRGFTDKGWFTNKALNAQLPLGYQLGAAYDDGDCFFDALAQCLNRIENTTKYTVKSLRGSCHKFYQENQKLVADWDSADSGKSIHTKKEYEQHQYSYSKILYTADECDSLFNKDLCIWGRPWIEGMMICQELNVKGICVINVSKDLETDSLILSYCFLSYKLGQDSPDETPLNKENFQALLEKGDISVLVNVEDKFHFVPLLKELESEEELSQLLVGSASESERNLLEASASSSTPPTKAKEKSRHESPDKSRKLENKVKISEEQYQRAEKLSEEYRASKKTDSKTKSLVQKAIGLYKEAANKGHKKAQEKLIELRNKGLCSNPDREAMASYKKAVETAVKAATKSDPSLTFEEFQNRARKIFNAYKKKIEDIKRKRTGENREPTWLGPMRISDLIVMDLDTKRVPVHIEWGGNYTSPYKANADSIFGPLFELSDIQQYEDGVMAIDPSGEGADETAYCVAKRYGDYYFITAVGGLAGKYGKVDSKANVGNSPKVLETLLLIAVKQHVSRIIIENNNDKSFSKLLELKFLELKSKKEFAKELEFRELKFNSMQQRKKKETRIIKTLQPLLSAHQLIIDRKVLQEDFNSEPQIDLYYKFFYQLMAIVVDKPASHRYFDEGKPTHDDRVDVVADAIRYLKNRKTQADKSGGTTLETLQNLQMKAKKGNMEAQLQLGRIYKNGLGVEVNYKKALKWYRIAAEESDSGEALFNLGEMYQNGLEVSRDEDQAFGFYQRAAKQTYAAAEYELGRMYQNGFGKIKKDDVRAFQWYEKAASQGHSAAAYELGRMHQNGFGKIKKDDVLVFQWYKKAVEHGHAGAAYELAKMCQNGFGEVEKDEQEAFKWYLTAAENGHLEAQLEVGDRYYKGQRVNLSYVEAFKWYFEAALNGNPRAEYKLAKMYQNGWGVDRNDEQAFIWYLKAANQENMEAQFELGKIYQNGLGLETADDTEAVKWYKKALQQGHAEAAFNLGIIYEKSRRYKAAYKSYEKAAEKGYKAANTKLGWMNQSGLGVEKNMDIVLYYYRKGAE
ncbi:MAG: hypothetical protein BGO68_00395 [Candidatus Amoebophilus sp. 36-38]|nr:MAG: hypothetical protein BGO68_00395 [Candidatus Amoebophilus sp. 36-38]